MVGSMRTFGTDWQTVTCFALAQRQCYILLHMIQTTLKNTINATCLMIRYMFMTKIWCMQRYIQNMLHDTLNEKFSKCWAMVRSYPIFCQKFLIKKYEGLVYWHSFYHNKLKGSKHSEYAILSQSDTLMLIYRS